MQGLRTSDFQQYFAKVPELADHWVGVRPINKIPKKLGTKKFVIVNLSESSQPGSHWVVISRIHKHSLEIFNSLGFENLNAVKPYLTFPFRAELTYNNSPLQASDTSTCGLYCIYYAIHRFLNLDLNFEDFLEETFKKDVNKNELKVTLFCTHLLNLSHPTKLFDIEF